MNRTILLTVWIVFAFYHSIIAQAPDLSIFGTGGGMMQGGSTFLSYTFGEPFISYNQNENTWITEGFQQPEKIDLATSVKDSDGNSVLHIFPNPGISQLNIEWEDLLDCSSISIRNVLGQTISSDLIQLEKNTHVSIDHLQPGIYWLSIYCHKMPTITQSFVKL